MHDAVVNFGWASLFVAASALVGIVLILAASLLIPRLIERLTPSLDEAKELARGNRAVAEYFGRLVAACIIGISLVIAAAILGGIAFALF
jgi:hypothetical protein